MQNIKVMASRTGTGNFQLDVAVDYSRTGIGHNFSREDHPNGVLEIKFSDDLTDLEGKKALLNRLKEEGFPIIEQNDRVLLVGAPSGVGGRIKSQITEYLSEKDEPRPEIRKWGNRVVTEEINRNVYINGDIELKVVEIIGETLGTGRTPPESNGKWKPSVNGRGKKSL